MIFTVLVFFLNFARLASFSVNISTISNCTFSPWTKYDSCSVTCGGGYKSRRKFSMNETDPDCWKRNKIQTIPCGIIPCPIDCQLSPWTAWTPCLCETGLETRGRKIVQRPLLNGHQCHHWLEARTCFEQCQTGCSIEAWSEWTPCDETCGMGTSFRMANASSPLVEQCHATNQSRQCYAKNCKGHHRHSLTDLAQFAAFMTFSVCLFMCVLILVRIALGEGVC